MVSFSTVIPVYNRVGLIDRTLNSIIDLDLEIIVIDDGSTDGTAERLERYAERITILHQQHKGPGAGRNLGIVQATGDYILFLDSDDLWFDWSIDTFSQTILQYDYPAFVAGTAVEFTDESELSNIKSSPLETEFFADYYASSNQSSWLLGGAVAVKTEVLRQVGGYTSKWINGEDSDLWLKLGTAQHFVWIKSPCVLAYYQHPDSAVTNRQKTYEGAWHMIEQEQAGLYPGRNVSQQHRREILMRHIRPVSLAYLREGKVIAAWKMYQATFYWNLALNRFVYLGAFWFVFIRTFNIHLFNNYLCPRKTIDRYTS